VKVSVLINAFKWRISRSPFTQSQLIEKLQHCCTNSSLQMTLIRNENKTNLRKCCTNSTTCTVFVYWYFFYSTYSVWSQMGKILLHDHLVIVFISISALVLIFSTLSWCLIQTLISALCVNWLRKDVMNKIWRYAWKLWLGAVFSCLLNQKSPITQRFCLIQCMKYF